MTPVIPSAKLDDRLQRIIARALPSQEGISNPAIDEADTDVAYERGFRDGMESLALALQCLNVDRALVTEAVTTALEAYGNNT